MFGRTLFELWDNCWGRDDKSSPSGSRRLEVSQKRFFPIILQKTTLYPYDMLYTETQIPDIRQLYSVHILLYQYKNRTELKKVCHKYSTRQEHQFQLPLKKKAVGQKSSSYPCLYITLI